MINFPTIKTERLILNQISEKDIDDIIEYANKENFYKTTIGTAFPYTKTDAQFFIQLAKDKFEKEEAYYFAIRLIDNEKLIGVIDIRLEEFEKAAIGYAINENFQNKGFATEAMKAALSFGFSDLKLNKIYAFHFSHNPASGRVMQKCGMEKEGYFKQHTKKDNQFFDAIFYGILKSEFTKQNS